MNQNLLKTNISIFFLLFLLSCQDSTSDSVPKNLIDEATMENIIYDATTMDVMSTFVPKNQSFIDILGSPYLFLKYEIDSLQLTESQEYYSKNPKVMSKIYRKVLRRMEKSKDSIDRIVRKKNN